MSTPDLHLKRTILGRLVFLFFFISLSFRFFIGATPSSFLEPVLFRVNFDYTYWVYKISGLPNLIVENKIGSIIFDTILLVTCFLCLLYPLKTYLCRLFTLLFFLYAISYNMYVLHHAHPLTVMTLITIPFCFRNIISWNFLWDAIRYYVCYLYSIAFVWKAFIGKSFLFGNMGINSLKANMIEYIYYSPDSAWSTLYKIFLTYPTLANFSSILIFLLEGVMVIGFFTKKFDSLILFFPIIIHVVTYLFSDVFFFDILIGVLSFLSMFEILKLKSAFPLIAK
jgi:hypothetical protein